MQRSTQTQGKNKLGAYLRGQLAGGVEDEVWRGMQDIGRAYNMRD